MYDLTVEEVHTFAVGDGDWVVHNTDCDFWIGDGYFEKRSHQEGIPENIGADSNNVDRAYGHYDTDGTLIRIRIYNGQGQVIYDIDAPDGGRYDYWHLHTMRIPGDAGSGHVEGAANHPEIGDGTLESAINFMRDGGFFDTSWLIFGG